MFPVLLFALVTVQNVCNKGKFILKETILSNVKKINRKVLGISLAEKIISSIDGTANMAAPYCIHLDNFFNLTSALCILV